MPYREKFESIYGKLTDNKTTCPHHEDKKQSLHCYYDTGKMICFSCKKENHIDKILGTKIIDKTYLDDCHKALLANPSLVSWLVETKGISLEIIKALNLGYNGDRHVWPVLNAEGECINCRLYSSASSPKIINYAKGYGELTIFPFPPKEEVIYLMEGESDCLLARTLGLAAYTGTGGCKGWNPAMTEMLRGKKVNIVYDQDTPGRTGANSVVNAIKFQVAEVKTIVLPMNPKNKGKDFSDWILKDGGTVGLLEEIAEGTQPHLKAREEIRLDGAVKVPLALVYRSEYAFKPVKVTAMVAGKDRAPFIVPWKIKVECSPTQGNKSCLNCCNTAGTCDYKVDWQEGKIIKFLDATEDSRDLVIKKMFGISEHCRSARIAVTDFQNVERLALLPYKQWYVIDQSGDTPDQSLRSGCFLGTGIKGNCAYEFTGLMIPNPMDQSGLLLASEAEPMDDRVEEVDMTLPEEFRLDKEVTNDTLSIQIEHNSSEQTSLF